MGADDLEIRLARLEVERDGLEALLRTELRGYADGIIRSVQHDVTLNYDDIRREMEGKYSDLQRQIDQLRVTVHGHNGDNGMRSDVKRQTWIIRLQWVLLAAMFASEFGVRLGIL